jgi:hypothetical protein
MAATIEHVPWMEVWSLSPERALSFFGHTEKTALVVVLKEKPTEPREIEKYRDDAKLFGVRPLDTECSCKGCKRHLQVVP